MEQEVKTTAEQQACDDSYIYHRERKEAMWAIDELNGRREKRHLQEAEWDKTHKRGPIARWFIQLRRNWKDNQDEEREEELWHIANPIVGFHRWKEHRPS